MCRVATALLLLAVPLLGESVSHLGRTLSEWRADLGSVRGIERLLAARAIGEMAIDQLPGAAEALFEAMDHSDSSVRFWAAMAAGEKIGTHIEAANDRSESRKRWLLTDRPQGSLLVDAGAARVLLRGGASLLPVGIRALEGDFERGAAVCVRAPDGQDIAQGLSNYGSGDLRKICGKKSGEIVGILGYSYGDAVLHRNNLVLL